jgi:hypothetical protein
LLPLFLLDALLPRQEHQSWLNEAQVKIPKVQAFVVAPRGDWRAVVADSNSAKGLPGDLPGEISVPATSLGVLLSWHLFGSFVFASALDLEIRTSQYSEWIGY